MWLWFSQEAQCWCCALAVLLQTGLTANTGIGLVVAHGDTLVAAGKTGRPQPY